MSLLSLSKVAIKFNEKTIINDFSIDIETGDKIAIKGPSGSGKSTILNIILGLIHPSKGVIRFNGEKTNKTNIKELRNNIAWLPQNVNVSDKKVNDFLLLPFTYKKKQKHLT